MQGNTYLKFCFKNKIHNVLDFTKPTTNRHAITSQLQQIVDLKDQIFF